jgi:hypothetical protein
LVQEKYQEEKACDKRPPYIIIIIIIINVNKQMYKRRQAPKRNLKRQTTASVSLGRVCSQP